MLQIQNKKLAVTIFCLSALYLTWGVVYLSIKFALESFPPVLLSSIRYICAGMFILLWVFFVQKDFKLPNFHQLKIIFITSLCMIVIGGAFLNVSGMYINSGTVALLMGSFPLWMVIISWFLGYDKRPSLTVFTGLVGGFIGVIALAVSTGHTGGSNAVLGIIFLFISLFGWLIGSIYSKRHEFGMSMLKSLGFQMVIGGLVMFVLSVLIGEWSNFSFSQVTLKSFLSAVHLIFFGSIVGYTCYFWLLHNTPTHIAISYAYAEPVIAVIVGYLFGGEHIYPSTLFACTLIIISVFFVIKGKTS